MPFLSYCVRCGEGTFTPDGRFKVGGANVNFIIYYEVDDDNSKHALSLAAFGEDKDWVLLEKA